METIEINKKAIEDLIRLANELNDKIESLELIGDRGFMQSYKKAKDQIKKREFDNWNEL